MERKRLFTPVKHSDSARWARETLFLALLLNLGEGPLKTVASSASKSNLFFTSMYGASAQPNFGLKPRDILEK